MVTGSESLVNRANTRDPTLWCGPDHVNARTSVRRTTQQRADERADRVRRRQAELGTQQGPEGLVLGEGLRAVALGEGHLDDAPVGALAQRLLRHRLEPGPQGVGEPAGRARPRAAVLERVQAQLTVTLAF